MGKTIMVEILATTSQFRKELEGAVASTNKANSGFQKMGRAAGVAGLALGGVLAYGLEKSVKAAMAAQVSTARLQTAYRDAGLSMGAYGKQIGAVEAAGRQLGFSNTEIREGLGSLITATHSERQAQMDLGIAEDLSRFKHVDLATAVKAETMAHAGSYRMLKQLGIVITPVTAAMDKLREQHMKTGTAAYFTAEAAAKLSDKLATLREVTDKTHAATAGAAGAFAHTAAGEMAQFHAQTTALMESLGQALLPALTKVAEKLAEFAGYLAKHKVLAEALVIGIGGLAVALGALSIASTIAAADMSAFWIAATGGLILLVPLVAAAVFEIIKHWDAIKSAFEAVGSAVKNAVMDVVNFVKGHWPLLLGILTGPIGLAVEQIATHWHTIESTTVAAFNAVRGTITSAMGAVENTFRSGWNAVVSATRSALSSVEGAIRAAVGATLAAATAVGNAILHGIETGVHAVIAFLHTLPGKIAAAVGNLSGVLVKAGESVMSGLYQGLQHGLGKVTGLAGSVAGKIASIKGPLEKDLLLLQPHGRAIMEGLLIGLKDGLHHASTWIETTASSNLTHAGEILAGAFHKGWIGKFPVSSLTAKMAAAKASVDDWATKTGSDNLFGVGSHLADAVNAGFANPTTRTGGAKSLTSAIVPFSTFGGIGGGLGVKPMAVGGIVAQPTLALVGEHGPEAVVPLGRGGGMGGVNVTVHVHGALLGSSVPQVADTIRRELLRTNRRNTGGLGFG